MLPDISTNTHEFTQTFTLQSRLILTLLDACQAYINSMSMAKSVIRNFALAL
jgi:hypothetical protein